VQQKIGTLGRCCRKLPYTSPIHDRPESPNALLRRGPLGVLSVLCGVLCLSTAEPVASGRLTVDQGSLSPLAGLGWDCARVRLGDAFKDVVLHTFRHTCASRLVQAGVDIVRVQKWLGHKDIKTTMIYAKLAPGDLDVAANVLEPGGNVVPLRRMA
jgi:hypothetical protein